MSYQELKKRKRSDYRYMLDYRLRWYQLISWGRMGSRLMPQRVDSIVNQYLIDHCGRDPATSTEVGIMVNSGCNFFSQVAYPSVVDCGLRVSKLGKTSATYEVGIFKQGDDAVKAVGGFTHVFCEKLNKDTFVPQKQGMCKQVREGLEKLVVDDKAKL